MALNTELFRKIHEKISANPAVHSQQTWEAQHACLTTRCVAGWAVSLSTDEPLFIKDGYHVRVSDSLTELGERYHEVVPLEEADAGDGVYLVPRVARHLLGLSRRQADRLFYAPDAVAAEFVELAAAGRDADADRTLFAVEAQ